MNQHNDQTGGRIAHRIAAVCAITAVVGGSVLSSAHAAAAMTPHTSVFWKELDRVEDTNANGILGDPGDTAYWNFYGGGEAPANTEQLVINDPVIFGDEEFSIASQDLLPEPHMLEDMNAVRQAIRDDAIRTLGNIPPLPKRSTYETTNDFGQTTVDETSFAEDTETHHRAMEAHRQYVAEGIDTSDAFQSNGLRWSMVPKAFLDHATAANYDTSGVPQYVAQMQFSHVITDADVTATADGSCLIGSTATANYGWTQSELTLDATTGQPREGHPAPDGLSAVHAVAEVECATEATAPPQAVEPSAEPSSTPEPATTQQPQTMTPTPEETAPAPDTTTSTESSIREVDIDVAAEPSPDGSPTYNAFDNPDRVEPIGINSGQPGPICQTEVRHPDWWLDGWGTDFRRTPHDTYHEYPRGFRCLCERADRSHSAAGWSRGSANVYQ